MVEVPCNLQWFGQISQRYMFFKCSISREKYTTRRLMFPLRHHQKLSNSCIMSTVLITFNFHRPLCRTACGGLRETSRVQRYRRSLGSRRLAKPQRIQEWKVACEQWKRWLVVGYRGWNPIQFCREYNKPLKRSLLTNQFNWNVARVFDHCSCYLWINHAFPKIVYKIRCKCRQTLLGWRNWRIKKKTRHGAILS